MSKLRIFNPEHDLALAFGGTNYTPPPMARLLRRDLQLLPFWIADAGDAVFSQNAKTDARWIETVNSRYSTNVTTAGVKDFDRFTKIEPWGWNRYLHRRLFTSGVSTDVLPSEKDLENIRNLSHRRISIKIHHAFLELIPQLHDITPVECYTLDEVLRFARQYPCAYTKAPWSSSGKGIYRALDIESLDFTRWCSGIIKRQGSIMCEQPLNAVLDFAMEFHIQNSNTTFIGYSVFGNDTHSSFNGGLLQTSDQLHHLIASALGDENLLWDVREAAINTLNSLVAPHYSGYAGIDMMIYRDYNGTLQINPCIELNLRTTMGVVTSIISHRLLAEGSKGKFSVEFHKVPLTPEYYNEMERKHPLNLSSEGKITSGLQFLTPPYPDAQYSAYILIEK